jgi:hypothetical protein
LGHKKKGHFTGTTVIIVLAGTAARQV